jgi:hypothetical protein
MRRNLIRTAIMICFVWCMASCQTLIDHTEEKELMISVDSSGNIVTQEKTRKNTTVNIECHGEIDIIVDGSICPGGRVHK